jgi:tetratricopeptide (TPR) repeat protein
MPRFIFSVLFALCFFLRAAASEMVFDFNSDCIKGYRHLMALQYGEATIILKAELQKNPGNIIPQYLSDYEDCLNLLFNGDPKDYVSLKGNLEKRLELIEKGDRKSPWYRFCKANIYLHWALIAMRFNDQFKAASRFRKSFLLLKENKELYPGFEENKVLLGLEQAVAGAIPDNYKWLGSVLGVKGDVNKGIGAIVAYLNTHTDGKAVLHEEAMIYYIYLKFYLLNARETAWKYANSSAYSEKGNLMRSFVKTNIALNYRKAKIAEEIISRAAVLEESAAFPIMYYERAESMLLQLDPACTTFYQQFLNEYKGAHFVKDSWLKMAWVAYLQHDQKRSDICIGQVRQKGNAETDADKQALKFALNPVWPPLALLEVRLLIDGGSYNKALATIQRIGKKDLRNTSERLEYHFRYGRIFEELGQYDNALIFYTTTINMGRARQEHYAARAALQSGFIYETQGKRDAAVAQFKDCLDMRDHDAQSSIDQLAKAGLNRLGK